MNLIKLLSLYLIGLTRKLTQDHEKWTTREDVYNLRDPISRQLNWKLVDQFMNLQNTLIFETESKWDVASSRQKGLVKKLEHKICYCIMARDRIGIPTTSKTESSLLQYLTASCQCCHKEVHPRRCRDPKFPSSDSNSKQSHRHTVGLRSTSWKFIQVTYMH